MCIRDSTVASAYGPDPGGDAIRLPVVNLGGAGSVLGCGMDIELSYDMMGSRLRGVGSAVVEYDRLGNRPRRVGDWELTYDSLGSRLVGIGGAVLAYDRLGSRPVGLGQWALAYDTLGARLARVGPYELTYDNLGSRLRTMGPLLIAYDRLGSRPARVSLPEGQTTLPYDQLLALFFVLYQLWAAPAAVRRRSGRGF